MDLIKSGLMFLVFVKLFETNGTTVVVFKSVLRGYDEPIGYLLA